MNNELLNYLKIKNIFLELPGGITSVIVPVNMSSIALEIYSSTVIEINKCILRIEFRNGEEFRIVCDIEKNNNETNYYNCYYDDPLPESLLVKVSELDTLYQKCNKRTERRLEIGLENWQQFGMARCDCSFTTFSKHNVKTVISNASIHGVLLLGERSFAQNGELVTFNCNFTDGGIHQKANIVNISTVTTSYFRYSLHFLEPISIFWIKKIQNYEEQQQ